MISRYGENHRQVNSNEKSDSGLLLATFVQMAKPYQILIFPLTVWSGFEQAFITAEYTQVKKNILASLFSDYTNLSIVMMIIRPSFLVLGEWEILVTFSFVTGFVMQ